jgi:hypothetical protein
MSPRTYTSLPTRENLFRTVKDVAARAKDAAAAAKHAPFA